MTDVRESWHRIDEYITDYLDDIREFLRPCPQPGQLEIVEMTVNNPLPNDVRQSYMIHDGSNMSCGFFLGYSLLSLEQVTSTWTMLMQIRRDGYFDYENEPDNPIKPEGPIKQLMWTPRWIPIMDTGGNGIFVDLEPDDGGTVGQVIEHSHEIGPLRVLATSFGELLSDICEGLRSGKYIFDEINGIIPPETSTVGFL